MAELPFPHAVLSAGRSTLALAADRARGEAGRPDLLATSPSAEGV